MTEEKWKNCGLTYKIAHSTKWLLIFHHEVSEGKFSKDNAAFNLQKNKFSYISRISDYHYVNRFNESYEFLLEYPKEFPGEYNRWIQDKDPMSEWDSNITGTNATGFSPVSLSWKDRFGGLMRNHIDRSLLNGQTGVWFWNYAIGHISSQYISDEHKSPGPIYIKGNEQIHHHVSSIYLWLRISSPVCNLCTHYRKLPHFTFQSCFFLLFTFS